MRLEGGINFRDMGGYETLDGRKVKKGFFFRSGSLSRLTPQDCEYLKAFSIEHIIDYRDQHESAKDKDILWEGVQYECCPANPASHATNADHGDFFSSESLEALPSDFMETLYRQLPFGNSAYKKLFHKVDSLNQGALVQHCAVGKDRTGVGSALLLLSLGVPQETVIQDYLVTEQTLLPFKLKILTAIEPRLTAKAKERFEYMMSANENFLHTALREITSRYGSYESFFEQEYALTALKRDQWKKRFLE
ncbi:tyrosine protein phosphatase [Bdellovibrio bacteriovorus]|uniref:Tyrosine protein phosphatase n=1 Tax=Bdellovibrio bacteriovorus TaxID=959 RepID=A0A150WC23_BDEBC|nr:tyrosine-protein phosphatase [Bdellovibrio bacteriovorus]KYG60473.1 tyrosine protein phosphatase [Bdellovibrio bacteriovorus]